MQRNPVFVDGTYRDSGGSCARKVVEAVQVKTNSVAALAEQAIARGGRLVSVPRLVGELRRALPACEHTDDELGQLIAMIAISKGRNLSYLRVPEADAAA